jgi:hypothetical protein
MLTGAAFRKDTGSRLRGSYPSRAVPSTDRICAYTSVRCRLVPRTCCGSCQCLCDIHSYRHCDRCRPHGPYPQASSLGPRKLFKCVQHTSHCLRLTTNLAQVNRKRRLSATSRASAPMPKLWSRWLFSQHGPNYRSRAPSRLI